MSVAALPIAMLVPPINLLPLCAVGLLLARYRRRAGLMVAAAALLGLYALATPLVAGWLIAGLETGLPIVPPAQAPQAIVILSAEGRRSLGSTELAPGPLTLQREWRGAALARSTGLPVLVTGGSAGVSTDTLGSMMGRSMAEDFGIKVRWIESQSADTWENAADTGAILARDHITSIYVVTNAWHMRRALMAFSHTGLVVTAAPVRLEPLADPSLSDLIPTANAWEMSYYGLHEWIGCLAYAFRG